MKDFVKEYSQSKTNLFEHFGCQEEYFIKLLANYKWTVSHESEIYILTYWDENKSPVNTCIIKKDKKPCIYKSNDYTMIVGIDCVKMAFVFSNVNRIV